VAGFLEGLLGDVEWFKALQGSPREKEETPAPYRHEALIGRLGQYLGETLGGWTGLRNPPKKKRLRSGNYEELRDPSNP